MSKKAPISVSEYLEIFAILLILHCGGALAHEDDPHDNEAAHGGLIMAYQDLHFEVVLMSEGSIRLYYSDSGQTPLPATTVSNVVIEIDRNDQEVEHVNMAISASGDHWTGSVKPVVNPRTIIRVAFVLQGEPVVMELPYSEFPEAAPGPDKTFVMLERPLEY